MSTIQESKPTIEGRIYIGNVDFKAEEDDLKQFFEGLTVEEVSIPSKIRKYGTKTVEKHLGFAFVQFKTDADAEQAIEKYNGQEFKNRKIYVKKAVPEPTEEEKQKKNELFKAKKAEQAAAKKAKKLVKAQLKKSDASENASEASDAPEGVQKVESKPTEPREPKTAPQGKASDDTIFITNLDYKVNYKTLTTLFKDLSPKWIHVPTRKVPAHIYKIQKAKGRSIFNKGIAFVKFADHDTQVKAIEEFNGKEVNGRNIIVDVAVDARIPTEASEGSEESVVPEAAAINGDAASEATDVDALPEPASEESV
ncbi:hypothetical protein PSN45_000792 [Yamadazyma tenuis]|uniref:RRM domain-containing protein n=1 Tax=Candida tenuis (strain ATCC 10573 / BCRC 21748 / CBS 615 / JCM 9827 / NBRC 10315 / NRRL Y-1498 / VKM Y-70) TaxID=590646 RepID=G3BAQ2_CANTC|nr:uncharacterized protein CANTEDRAFT_115527 [Yamadazyma tenuis ATCC 10573]EGV62078.1 hypothetical protein CANTEDRAFT_115527 [Yamadazyma tenuis ATCC 10573]WEJ93329.1 hypothetical protein PSN45_000792 [Yamadazyma tenuis]